MVAVVVGAALALLSAAASGVETVPVNTAPPTISPTSPIEGKTETATQGTWSGSPTSFTYAWYRCSGSGACVSIPAATSSTYVPTKSDLTFTLRVLVTASNTMGSGSAISAATSVAKFPPSPYFWNSCKKIEGGKYTNSTCSVVGAGGFEWTKIATATPTSFTATGSSAISLKLPFFGGTLAINCKTQSSKGTLENPGSGTAKISGTSFEMTGCSVSEPAGCKVVEEALFFGSLRGTAVEGEEEFEVKLEPSSGTTLVEFEIFGCTASGSYPLNGSFAGIASPSSSSLEFTKASSAGLTFGGKAATIEGTTKLQTAAGESLKLTP